MNLPGPESSYAVHRDDGPIGRILDVLSIPSNRPVLIVAGWADAELSEHTSDLLKLLFRQVVLPVCRDLGVVVVSGGTNAGVMAFLGQAAADEPGDVILVGVAPQSKVLGLGSDTTDVDAAPPEPNHRLILTNGGSWGAESTTLVLVAEKIAGANGVTVLAVGGGKGAERELILAARRRWATLLLTGHGGASDSMATTLGVPPLAASALVYRDGSKPAKSQPKDQDGQQLARAQRSGEWAALDLGDRQAINRALRWRLSTDEILRDAWSQYAIADGVAAREKQPTSALAFIVVVLAFTTVLSAILSGVFRENLTTSLIFKGLATGLPLVAAVALGLIDRRARAGSWIELRAGAESILREIYRYRALAGPYATAEESRRLLAQALAEVDLNSSGRGLFARTRRAENESRWPPKSLWGRIHLQDALLDPLSAASYDTARVKDQLSHFERSADDLERRATRLSTLVFVLAGLAALLLAVSWKQSDLAPIAAVVTALAAACISWREYKQRDARVRAMLSTSVALRTARGRWLTEVDKEGQESMASFVDEVENALGSEGADWRSALSQSHQSFLDRQRGR